MTFRKHFAEVRGGGNHQIFPGVGGRDGFLKVSLMFFFFFNTFFSLHLWMIYDD